MTAVLVHCRAILFDLDGTLVDSFASANRAWSAWARDVGLGENFSLSGKAHGRRRPELVGDLLPGLSSEETSRHADRIRLAERDDLDGVTALPGAYELLVSLPPERWAIVTSCDDEVVRARLASAGLPVPDVLISADLLDRGKPDPQGYLLAAARLGVSPPDCLVAEDAEVGLQAARGAGMRALATRWTSPEEALSYALAIVDDLRPVRVEATADGLTVTVAR